MIYYNYIVYSYLGIEIPVVFSETMLHNEFHNWYSEALFPNNVRVSSGSLRWDNIKQQFVVFDYSYVLKPNSRKEDGLLLDRYLKEEPKILSIGLDIIIIPKTDRYDILFAYINSLYPENLWEGRAPVEDVEELAKMVVLNKSDLSMRYIKMACRNPNFCALCQKPVESRTIDDSHDFLRHDYS
jgi:hypothetical protein